MQNTTTPELTREQESTLDNIETTAADLFRANRRLVAAAQGLENDLLAGYKGIAPDVRVAAEVAQLQTELHTFAKLARRFGVDEELIEVALRSGIVQGR